MVAFFTSRFLQESSAMEPRLFIAHVVCHDLVPQIGTSNLASKLSTEQEGAAELPIQRVSLGRRRRQSMLEHDRDESFDLSRQNGKCQLRICEERRGFRKLGLLEW
jgi:hypothetical protein